MHRLSQRALLGVAVAVLVLSATACSATSSATSSSIAPGSSTSSPLTMHAANGSVHIEKKPTAIISLSPTATEML